MRASEVTYRAHDIEEHLLRSNIVSQTFRIKVFQPISRSDNSERFSVLYAPDSEFLFGGLSDLARLQQILGDTQPYILVGIGYEETAESRLLRWRDFVTHSIRSVFQATLEQLAESALVGGSMDLKTITCTSDAAQFLGFIREELMPFITARYPVLTHDNNYYGYSAGATFGLITLLTQPNTFKRYILGSPVTCQHGQHFGLAMAEAFVESRRRIDAKVFLSVGELEEFEKGAEESGRVTGYYRLVRFLKNSAIPGLDLAERVFPGETHGTAWTAAFNHGVRTLFGPLEHVPYLPEWK